MKEAVMSTAISETSPASTEFVEVSAPRVHNLHHVELLTPRIEESLDFFTRVLGLHETGREGQSVYLRTAGEFAHHSTVLTESDRPGLGHMGWQVAEAEHLEGWSRRLREANVEHALVAGGNERAHGDTLRVTTPFGHVMELFYEFERLESPTPSKLLSQPTRYPAPGIGVRRLDHLNITVPDVDVARDWYVDTLGFKLREAARTPDGDIGVWLSVTSQVHDIAIMRDGLGKEGRLHHIAYNLDTPEGILRATDILLDEGVTIDTGPGKHGLTQAFFVYLFEPGGNRIELFSGGYVILGPDWQPIIWEGENLARAIVWFGGELPASFFEVAT
jgi:catechol 2,3-dioxygenase